MKETMSELMKKTVSELTRENEGTLICVEHFAQSLTRFLSWLIGSIRIRTSSERKISLFGDGAASQVHVSTARGVRGGRAHATDPPHSYPYSNACERQTNLLVVCCATIVTD